MNKEEFFVYNGITYPKGTVVWRVKDNKVSKMIFMWRYTDGNRYLVISVGGSTIPGHLPRSVLLPSQFFDDIVSIEKPSSNDLLMVKELEKDFARQRNQSNDGALTFLAIIAMVVGTMLFPPLGLILGFYAFTRKK